MISAQYTECGALAKLKMWYLKKLFECLGILLIQQLNKMTERDVSALKAKSYSMKV